MAIERLSIHGGVSLRSKHFQADLLKYTNRHIGEFRPLEPDTYDLTPKHWRRHTHYHFLHVFPSGIGAYEAIPRDESAGFVEPTEKGIGEFTPGAITKFMPLNESVVVLGGPDLRGKNRIRVYEVILYHPEDARREPVSSFSFHNLN